MMLKASIGPLARYSQPDAMSQSCTPPKPSLWLWSNVTRETCRTSSSGRGELGRKGFRAAKIQVAQKAASIQITHREQVGRHWKSLYNLRGEQRACKQHRKVESAMAVGINANGSPGNACFRTKSQIRSEVIDSLFMQMTKRSPGSLRS